MIDRFKLAMEKYSDLFLAAAVVMLVATMIIGVSPAAMDVLIAINIATAVIVLMVALYTAEPVKVSAFPTVLLLTTVFRLALNVSSTRLILVQEDAGEVIEAFGRFVVGGDFVVGAIVFVVLVLVQFIVIAKGAERVAEVGARFTLDALPGKQMSIDADMRNGLIDEQGAKQRRELLDKEAKLYGAMDGAMKFVKGDAIAGILISLVNIVGGLVVGLTRDMEIGEAAATFTLLTVGDGLVSQIPALLISVAAGLVVTRVGDPNQSTSGRLSRDIIQQVADNPRSLAVASVFLIVIGISAPWTGFPALPFLMLGAAVGMGFAMRKRDGEDGDPGSDSAGSLGGGPSAATPSSIANLGVGGATLAPPAVVIEIHPALDEAFFAERPEDSAADRVARPEVLSELLRMQHAVTRALGVPIPRILLASEDRKVPSFGYAIVVHGEPLASGQFLPGHVIALTTPEAAMQHGLDAIPALLPGTRIVAAQIPSDQADAARAVGLQVSEVRDVVFRHVALVLQRHATEFLGIQEVSDLLEELRQSARDLVDTVVQRLKIDELTDVLQGLLADEVPISGLRNILESLARRAGRADPRTDLPVGTDSLIESVRLDIRRALCARFAEGERRLRCYSLDAELEAQLRKTATGQVADALTPAERGALQTKILAGIDPYVHLDKHPILVVSEDLRRETRRLLRPVAPECAVLTHEELSPEFVIDHVAVIRSSGAEAVPAPA